MSDIANKMIDYIEKLEKDNLALKLANGGNKQSVAKLIIDKLESELANEDTEN